MNQCASGLARCIAGLLVIWMIGGLAGVAPTWLVTGSAHAADVVDVTRASIDPSADGEQLLLNADFVVPLSRQLEDAVNRGLPLYFVAEIELRRKRWYWFSQLMSSKSQTYRLSYHALTQQYRVTVSGYTQRYARLDDALAAVSHLRGLPIAERGELIPAAVYEASIRLRLDTSQLPKPFQFSAITDGDWNLLSAWKRLTFTSEATTNAPLPELSGSR